MKRMVLFCLVALLVACGGENASSVTSSGGENNGQGGASEDNDYQLPAPDGQGQPGPQAGESRAGRSYDVKIIAQDGETIAFTVHEPVRMEGGESYPLLMHGSGFAGPRVNAAMRNLAIPPEIPVAASVVSVKFFLDAGYGVVSFDQRGFGESTGSVTVMDPDRDGVNLVQVVDWAESNLDWLAYRNDNLLLGAIGASYGGGYQLLLNNVDPLRRLDAMIPSITWYDLGYSLGPGGVPKSAYGLLLNTAGELSSGYEMDAELRAVLQNGLTLGRYSEEDEAVLLYRSNRYFCEGNTLPGKREATPPPKVDALILQGMHDVLFNFNEGKANYDCLSAAGGDVRLFTYNIGHILPAGIELLPQSIPDSAAYGGCGPYDANQISLDWLDAKLKGDAQARDRVAAFPQTCIVLDTTGEAVELDGVPVGGVDTEVPQTTVPVLAPFAQTVPLFTATETTVVAGIPTATLTIENPFPLADNPAELPLGIDTNDVIIYVSLLHSRFGLPGYLATTDDQIRPIRGFGEHTLELNGISAKLKAGDRVDMHITTLSLPQYPLMFARNPAVLAVNVSGSVQLPVLGNMPTVH